jgi:hypothetical protein
MRQTHSACTRKWTRNTRQGNGQSVQVGATSFAVPVDDPHQVLAHFRSIFTSRAVGVFGATPHELPLVAARKFGSGGLPIFAPGETMYRAALPNSRNSFIGHFSQRVAVEVCQLNRLHRC